MTPEEKNYENCTLHQIVLLNGLIQLLKCVYEGGGVTTAEDILATA